ncbi:MFS transporter [Vibrio parahaemolyticus]
MSSILFSNRSFFYLWARGSVTSLCNKIFFLSFGFYLADVYDSISLSSTVFLIAILPQLFVSTFSGYFVDRYKKKTILIFCDCILIFIISAYMFFFYLYSGNVEHWVLYVGVGVNILLTSFGIIYGSAVFSYIPLLVSNDELNQANGSIRTSEKIVDILGSLFGAAIYSIFSFLSVIFLLPFSIALSMLCTLKISSNDDVPSQELEANSVIDGIRFGIDYIISDRELVLFFLFRVAINFLFTPIVIALPFFVKSRFDGDITYYTYLMVALTVGAIIGHMFSNKVNNIHYFYNDNSLFLSAFFMVFPLMFLALSTEILLAVVCMFVCGFFNGVFSVNAMTTTQRKILPKYRGRVISSFSFISTFFAMLSYLFTLAYDQFNIDDSEIIFFSSILMMLTVIAFSLSGSFRKYLKA